MKHPLIIFLLIFISASLPPVHDAHAKPALCSAIFYQPAGKPDYRFNVFDASHTLSQLVRDNFLDFSYFTKYYADSVRRKSPELYPALKALVQHEAWIAGDNHSGNYIVSPINGKMKYYFSDIKDGGLGSMFYNFADLVLNTHSVAKRADALKIKDVVDELIGPYLKGLRGEPMSAPESVREALATPTGEYGEMVKADTEGFLKHGTTQFKVGKRNLSPISEVAGHEAIVGEMSKALLSTGRIKTVHDFALRERERGGSRDLDRYWALVELKSGELRIVEFKEINLPATQVYRTSGLSLRDHTQKMMSVYYPQGESLLAVTELNGKLFLMRPRKVDLVSVPYKQKNERQTEELLDLARYAAYHTGIKQAASSKTAAAYRRLLESDPQSVRTILRQFIKDYYAHLAEKFEQNSAENNH